MKQTRFKNFGISVLAISPKNPYLLISTYYTMYIFIFKQKLFSKHMDCLSITLWST